MPVDDLTIPTETQVTEIEMQAALDRLSVHAFELGLNDREMPEGGNDECTRNQSLNRHLPFSCNERRQTAASQCKAKILEVIEKTKKSARYG